MEWLGVASRRRRQRPTAAAAAANLPSALLLLLPLLLLLAPPLPGAAAATLNVQEPDATLTNIGLRYLGATRVAVSRTANGTRACFEASTGARYANRTCDPALSQCCVATVIGAPVITVAELQIFPREPLVYVCSRRSVRGSGVGRKEDARALCVPCVQRRCDAPRRGGWRAQLVLLVSTAPPPCTHTHAQTRAASACAATLRADLRPIKWTLTPLQQALTTGRRAAVAAAVDARAGAVRLAKKWSGSYELCFTVPDAPARAPPSACGTPDSICAPGAGGGCVVAAVTAPFRRNASRAAPAVVCRIEAAVPLGEGASAALDTQPLPPLGCLQH